VDYGRGGVLDLDKYVSMADMFYMGGCLRLESSGIWVNRVFYMCQVPYALFPMHMSEKSLFIFIYLCLFIKFICM